MIVDLQQIALVAYLKARNNLCYDNVFELRQVVQDWLSFPQIFSHYTGHIVQHSDGVVSQISKLPFEANDPEQPVIRLSAAEAYVLTSAAYLHDAGLVVPDREKAEILASSAWKACTSGEGCDARSWRKIQALWQGREPADESVRKFLADVQTRLLIAEFVPWSCTGS